MKVTVEFTRPALPGRRRTRLALVALAAFLALPTTALASHIFSDVPDTMTGHAAIEAIYDARITAGCTATTYCPTAPVTREQMALFLQRALPRIAGAQDLVASQVTSTEQVQNEVTLRAGGTSGGKQFVKVDVPFTVEVADVTGCPCELAVYITSSTGATSEGTFLTLTQVGFATGAATLTFPVPSGTTVTIDATATLEGTGEAYIYTDISAISGAFGSQGTDAASVPSPVRQRGTR